MLVSTTADATETYVAPLAATGTTPGVLQVLQTAAGSGSPSLAMVPGGAGCTATGQAEVVLADGSTEAVNATVPDADVSQALSALSDFLSGGWIPVLMADGVVDGVAIDFSTSPASPDVTADDGEFGGVSDATYTGNLIADSFEGVPVKVSTVDDIDLTTDAAVLGSN